MRAVRTSIGGAIVALVATFLVAGPLAADPIEDKQAEAARVAGQLDDLENRMMELDRSYSEAQAALADAEARIAESQAEVEATKGELDDKRAALREIAIDAYVEGNDSPGLDTLLRTEPDTAPQRSSYYQVATGNRADVLDELEGTRQKLDAQLAELADAQSEAAAHSDEMKAARDEGAAALDQERAIKARIDGELADLVRAEQERQAAARQAQLEEQARQQAAADAAARQQAAAAQAARATQATAPAPAPTGGGTTTTTAPRATGGTGGTGGTPAAPAAPAPSQPTPAAPAPSGGAGAAVSAAYSALGVPYVFGGSSMSGFDCSGLTSWAWAKGGKSLPRTTGGQWSAGTRISMSELQPGDLVFYNGLGHVALYVGGGTVIHAPRTGTVVRTDSVYFWGPIDGAVRP